MRIRVLTFLMTTLLLMPVAARAQDFGVMESAETIDRGTFKLKVNPMWLFGRDGADGAAGVNIGAGYGVTDRFDVEGAVAFYDDFKFFGGNAEYWLLRRDEHDIDMSVSGGVHFGRGEFLLDRRGIDLTFLVSKLIRPRLELYGGLDFAFESIEDDFFEDDFTTVHLVPGIEYAINQDLDFVAELGLGLNNNSNHYISGGLAYYFR